MPLSLPIIGTLPHPRTLTELRRASAFLTFLSFLFRASRDLRAVQGPKVTLAGRCSICSGSYGHGGDQSAPSRGRLWAGAPKLPLGVAPRKGLVRHWTWQPCCRLGGGGSVGELGLRERLPETPSIQSPSEPSLVQPIPWMLQRTAEAQDRTDPGTLTAGRACPYGLAPYISVSGIPWTCRRSWPQRQPGKWVLASPTQVGL